MEVVTDETERPPIDGVRRTDAWLRAAYACSASSGIFAAFVSYAASGPTCSGGTSPGFGPRPVVHSRTVYVIRALASQVICSRAYAMPRRRSVSR